MKFEYRCHECGKQLKVNSLAVYEEGFGRVFCPSQGAPLEEDSCARKFVEGYIKKYEGIEKEIRGRSYYFMRLKDLDKLSGANDS